MTAQPRRQATPTKGQPAQSGQESPTNVALKGIEQSWRGRKAMAGQACQNRQRRAEL